MTKTDKADMSCARVKQYTASDVSKAERHNERKNETYENMNVIVERIPFNVHFKKPTAPTYMEQLKQMETDGMVSLRGLRKDATLFDEIVIDVNTMYFERNGGYEYAKQFYEEAYHFIEEKFGADNVISAVMHADEINVAATEELGKEVYHYHLHTMVLPVVEKEILWSKRCKDEKLRGTVKEVVNQISHSKKWKSDIPMTDEKGNPLLKKNGKPMFRASYSILQDELFNYMTEQGFKGFQRGEYGSTAEHLTSLQYQIQQDKERLEKLQKRIQKLIAGFTVTSRIYFIAVLVSLISVLAVFGVQGWNCDFQILSTTAYYGLKIWQVVFVGIVINYVVVLSVMAFTLLLSAACKTPFAAVLISTLCTIVPMFLPTSRVSGVFNKLLCLFPAKAMDTHVVFSTYVLFSFGKLVVILPCMILIAACALIIVTLPVAHRKFCRHQVA